MTRLLFAGLLIVAGSAFAGAPSVAAPTAAKEQPTPRSADASADDKPSSASDKASGAPADGQRPQIRRGGGVGITAAVPSSNKRKATGTQVVTTTIGGDGVDAGEQLATAGATQPASQTPGQGSLGTAGSAANSMRALLDSPAFQQKLLAGAAAQTRRRDDLSAGAGGMSEQIDTAKDTTVSVMPGVVEVQPIAKGYLNRIITPFENPRVYTINPIDTKVDGNVVYVSTRADQPDGPVDIYITDITEGADDTAISLSLTPMDIPAREMRIKFVGRSGGGSGLKSAQKWETSQPYVSSIKELMKALAINQLPQGYSLSATKGVQARCEIPGFVTKLGQVIDGHNFRVAVFVVRNVSNVPREITEQACYRKGVAAVAAWPSAMLDPNKEAELFVVLRMDVEDKVESAPARPSLISSQR